MPVELYPDMDGFYNDLGQAYKKAVRAFADAGSRYLQLDETNLTYLCDEEQRQMLRDRGDNPDALLPIYAKMINTSISDIPADMRITMHLCRGNYMSLWIAQGGYEPVADVLFNEINVNGYFMEYDDRQPRRWFLSPPSGPEKQDRRAGPRYIKIRYPRV